MDLDMVIMVNINGFQWRDFTSLAFKTKWINRSFSGKYLTPKTTVPMCICPRCNLGPTNIEVLYIEMLN